jgi:hypothetical protein
MAAVCLSPAAAFADDRAIQQASRAVPRRLNTLETFSAMKPNDMVCLLVGIDDYAPDSGYPALSQCVNDTRLLSRILEACCKVPAANIIPATNLSAAEFLALFRKTVSGLPRKSGFFFSYSGHGSKDGSLVFKDGKPITPETLKELMASFPNDSVMMLDACYSGNNEGPFDTGETKGFRANVTRVYASLAHMAAKEIVYSNQYFSSISSFYREVLGLESGIPSRLTAVQMDGLRKEAAGDPIQAEALDRAYSRDEGGQGYALNASVSDSTHLLVSDAAIRAGLFDPGRYISGNGYFTSFIGYFFAEYDFRPSRNVSFADLIGYMTNKGKQYVEFLAMRGNESRSASAANSNNYYYESTARLNQQPKIFPLAGKPELKDPNHEFLAIKKYIEPVGLRPLANSGVFYSLGLRSPDAARNVYDGALSFAASAQLSYEPVSWKGFSAGLGISYLSAGEPEDPAASIRGSTLIAVPIELVCAYRLPLIENALFASIDIRAGAALETLDRSPYIIYPRELTSGTNICAGAGLTVGYSPLPQFLIEAGARFDSIWTGPSSALLGLYIPLSLSYRL